MKSGYDQFFSEVRKQKAKFQIKPQGAPEPKAKAPKSPKPPRPTRAKRPFPWQAILGLPLGLAVGYWGFTHRPKINQMLGSVEIQLFGDAEAANTANSAGTDPSKQAKTSAQPTQAQNCPDAKAAGWTPEELNSFSKLNERKKELDLREAELNKLEEELQQQKVLLDQRLQELTDLRAKIADSVKSQVQTDDAKVDKLVEFYSNMKPQQAARVMENIDEDLAVETLTRMKKKNAAAILDLLDPKKAESLSEKIAGYRR